MATTKKPAGPTQVEAIVHGEKRSNIPTADAQDFVGDDVQAVQQLRWPRDPSLDPQLVWKGKDADADELVADGTERRATAAEKSDPNLLLLVNGSGAMAPIRSDLQGIDTQNFDRGTRTVGVLGDVRVVGWSTNLQSSRGVTNDFRGRLANRVKELASST